MIAIFLDLVAIATAYIVASIVYLADIDAELLVRSLAAIIPIFFLFALATQSYPANILLDGYRSAWRAASALVWASLLMLLIFFFLKISDEFSRVVLALGTVFSAILISATRMNVARSAAQALSSKPFAHLYLFDDVPVSSLETEESLKTGDIGLEPMPDSPAMQDLLGRLARGLDGIVVHCSPEKREQWAFMLKSLDVRTEIVVPELSALNPLMIESRQGEASLVLGSGQLSWSQRAVKRCFDLIVTISLLPALGTLAIMIAVLIKLDSKGPVLFKQDRIGLSNRKFKILKFRTMRIDMLDAEAKTLTKRDDPRVTRLGSFLRKTSLDELPQFLNVLMGDMSIVGPRPHAEAARAGGSLYWEVDQSYWHRHVVKPGITGLAQIRGYRGNTLDEKHLQDRLNADLEYVSNWSVTNDLVIILRTLGVVVHRNAF
ncbi:sugar transferase [Altererythrobacter ishigakiensis]|uniref:Lipopolysaccharide/colanic/teichoic acid biosynthesis glycosyltransferase n=1 Tax=Altererythrobacter ishigakiensis TaxID=476157 RepID=A0A562USP5_9SPHN|nr:sugar transferase [Altererythrobacter ishigakiensis]TWJ08633.1 lipopolysaccharide/colanic/teichoic acid biosynthesis glycosyltransferase [Altererythrobacter ishigakiensis]